MLSGGDAFGMCSGGDSFVIKVGVLSDGNVFRMFSGWDASRML